MHDAAGTETNLILHQHSLLPPVLTTPHAAVLFCACVYPSCPPQQLVLEPQQVVLGLPFHVLACLLGYMSGILKTGQGWASELTDCTITDSGPLDHVVRGASVLVTFMELIPRFRCVSRAETVSLRTRVWHVCTCMHAGSPPHPQHTLLFATTHNNSRPLCHLSPCVSPPCSPLCVLLL